MTDSEMDYDKEMIRQLREALPNPFEVETLYPAMVTIDGVSQRFVVLKTARGILWAYLLQTGRQSKLERIARFSVSKRGAVKWYSPFVPMSESHKHPALSDKQAMWDEWYQELKGRINVALEGE